MTNTLNLFRTMIVVLMSVCVVAGCGESGGTSAPLSVNTVQETAPSITVQPKAVDLALGETATFNVEAAGSNLKYQWKKDGVALAGATTSTYSIPALSAGDAGSTLTVAVSNSVGAVESQGATISVYKLFPQLEPKGYLTLNQIAVSDLLSNEPVGALSVSIADGPDLQIKIGSDGIIRYLSPEEQYRDTVTTVAFKDAANGLRHLVPMAWSSRVGPSINAIMEGEGSDATSLTVTMDGGARGGYIHDGVTAIVYTLQSTKQISAEASEISLETKASAFDITSWFDIKPEAGTVTLKNEYLPQLKKTMKEAGFASVVFSLSTQNYEDTYGFESELQYAGASLTVKLVDEQGKSDPATAGDKYVVTGLNTGLKVLSTVSADGEFVVNNVPVDTYSVEKVLLEPGAPVVGFYPFDNGPTDGVLTLITKRSAALLNGVAIASFTDKVASAPTAARKQWLSANAKAAQSSSDQSGADYTVSTQSGVEGQLNAVPVDYTIPDGTTEVGVEVIVTSEEFPKFTSLQSEFNDVWQFSVSVPGHPTLARTGKVNQTHATAGEFTLNQCFKLGVVAAGGLKVEGQIGAQNVGDSIVNTAVTVNVNKTCGLSITAFTGVAKSSAGTLLLYPRKTAKTSGDGNINGQYLSLPISAQLPASFSIPSTLKFTPDHAIPTEVELSVRSPHGIVSLGKSYLQQGVVSKSGIGFKTLNLAPAQHTPSPGAVELVATLTATVDGQSMVSKPVPITIDEKYSVFTPMYLADNMPSYNKDFRFSYQTEPGGDSWGTYDMHSWLAGTPYRYNDLSAANVGQNAEGRSVLDHSGHSDGRQIDVRYADGSGGFTETLGGNDKGAGIDALAKAAKIEFDAGVTPTPNLDKLRNWVKENRTVIDKECASPGTRRVYVGNSFVYSLLNAGVFPGTSTAIPGAGSWTTKSPKVLPQKDHLDHWHINRQ